MAYELWSREVRNGLAGTTADPAPGCPGFDPRSWAWEFHARVPTRLDLALAALDAEAVEDPDRAEPPAWFWREVWTGPDGAAHDGPFQEFGRRGGRAASLRVATV